MKIIKNIIYIAILVLVFPFLSVGQTCANFINYQNPSPPYKFNSQSKSATCLTGRNYKLKITLMEGRDYNLSFFASAVFDNNIHFKIIDETNSKVVLDASGKPDDPEAGSVLVPKFSLDGQNEYPSYNFYPQTTTQLKIEIDVAPAPEGKPIKKGCIGVLIQDKPTEFEGFGFE